VTRSAGPCVAVLDANVLYPQWLRDLMLTLAAMGHYEPLWSAVIIDEMRRNVLRDHPDIDPGRFNEVTIAALRRAFPDAWVSVDDALIAEMDNEPGDRHVLAAAVAGSANIIVTANTANTADFDSARYVARGSINTIALDTGIVRLVGDGRHQADDRPSPRTTASSPAPMQDPLRRR
jgi:predicted nucleic acid-binding protein